MAVDDHPGRPRLLAGLGLPLRALGLMARHPEERGPLLLVASLLIAGMIFYVLVEGWSVVDAVYFCAMSLATVGFGDVVPETAVGKLFTVVYVLAGIGILVSFFTALTSKTLELQAERRTWADPTRLSTGSCRVAG
jgi:voltage-gated potassium channel